LSSRRLKIGLVQMSMSPEREDNVERAGRMVADAASRGASIVCLPELFSTRYFPSERGRRPTPEPIPGPTSRALATMARVNRVVLVGGSLFEAVAGRRYNTCPVFSEKGSLLGAYRKVHIPQDEHYYEQDYFSPGGSYSVVQTSAGRVGTLICFDQWYPEAARANRMMGAQLLFYPTAIGWLRDVEPAEGDWHRAWEAVQVGHAISNSLVVCAVNRVGTEEGTRFWGGSFACDQFGKVLVRAGDRPGVFTADVDLDLGARVEDGWGFLRNRRSSSYSEISR